MRAADLLLVTSGTATLEAALLGTPMVVCYRVSRLTEAWVRLLVRVPWISLANITLGRAVVPEIYQRASPPSTWLPRPSVCWPTPAALAAQRAGVRRAARPARRARGRRARRAIHVLALAQC